MPAAAAPVRPSNRILIHRHPDCVRCARIAATHHRLDLHRRIADTTAPPASGPLRLGEIVVEDLATGRLHHGVDAFRAICAQVPFYRPLLPLLRIPAFRRRVEADITGCRDGACEVPAR